MRGTISDAVGVDEIQTLPTSDGVNPEPIVLADTEILANDYLSPSRLEEIAGRRDLENITMMEMTVNTSETTMGNFGSYLPCLKYLKLSNSVIPSVRDLGTSLSHLTVLWMSCCGLHDVDGIASMISLTELYLSYNDIDDISPLAFMDELQVLDLEGNQISDKEQFDYLSMLSKLSTLSISGNPVCQVINREALSMLESDTFESSVDTITYREFILRRLPQLKFIDDEKCDNSEGNHAHSSSDRPSTASLAASSHSQEDIELITNAIKEGLITEEETAAICLGEELDAVCESSAISSLKMRPASAALRRPGSASSRPSTATPLGRSLISPSSRPQTTISGGRGGSAGSNRPETILQKAANAQRPNSSGSGDVSLEDESSTLTFGDVICGNPIKALRSRKASPLPVLNMLKRNQSSRPLTAAPSTNIRKVDPLFDDKERNFDNKDDILSDLKQWRLMHEERLKQRSADVQILKIHDDTSSEEISFDSDGLNSESDILESDHNNDKNDSELELHDILNEKKVVDTKWEVVDTPTSSNRTYSPPPKNLNSASLCSSRSSSRSPASPIYSSSLFESATVPVLVSHCFICSLFFHSNL